MGCEQLRVAGTGGIGLWPAGVPVVASRGVTLSPRVRVSLPPGWLLCGGAGYQLTVICGTVWLTDARRQDIWLATGGREVLEANALVEAGTEAVLQLSALGEAFPTVESLRLVVDAVGRRVVVGARR